MEPNQKPIILSYREGCSGSWLGEVLHVCKFDAEYRANFRQDRDHIPESVYHFGGHRDETAPTVIPYQNQCFVTCHVDQPAVLARQWPNARVYRIIPSTYILDAIAASWYKLPPVNNQTVDHAMEYIKTYHELHTKKDPRFGTVIDYGQLRNLDWIANFVESNGIKYNPRCDQFVKDYWSLQKMTNIKTIEPGLTMQDIESTLALPRNNFYMALAIFIFETSNRLQESQRSWSIDDIDQQYDLLDLAYVD